MVELAVAVSLSIISGSSPLLKEPTSLKARLRASRKAISGTSTTSRESTWMGDLDEMLLLALKWASRKATSGTSTTSRESTWMGDLDEMLLLALERRAAIDSFFLHGEMWPTSHCQPGQDQQACQRCQQPLQHAVHSRLSHKDNSLPTATSEQHPSPPHDNISIQMQRCTRNNENPHLKWRPPSRHGVNFQGHVGVLCWDLTRRNKCTIVLVSFSGGKSIFKSRRQAYMDCGAMITFELTER